MAAASAPSTDLSIFSKISLIEASTAGEQSNPFQYVPYMPVYDRNTITFPIQPPILKNLSPLLYPFPKELGGPCQVRLNLTYPESPDYAVDFPLQLSEYLEPAKDRIYTLDESRLCDEHNQEVFDHNEFVVKLLTFIARHNGCKTSAGVITQQGKPVTSACELYQAGVMKYATDHYARLKHAVTYLSAIGLFPCSDYDISSVVEMADIISYFKEAIARLSANKHTIGYKVRIRFTGQPPLEWDGITPQRTMDGSLLRWIPNNMHMVKYPNCIVACKRLQPYSSIRVDTTQEEQPTNVTCVSFEGMNTRLHPYGTPDTQEKSSMKEQPKSTAEPPSTYLSCVESFETFNTYLYHTIFASQLQRLQALTKPIHTPLGADDDTIGHDSAYDNSSSDADSSSSGGDDNDDDDLHVSSDTEVDAELAANAHLHDQAHQQTMEIVTKIVSFVYDGHPRSNELIHIKTSW